MIPILLSWSQVQFRYSERTVGYHQCFHDPTHLRVSVAMLVLVVAHGLSLLAASLFGKHGTF